MSMLAIIICLICPFQKSGSPVQFTRPSKGRHGPLNWPPVEVNQWKTLVLTTRLVMLKDDLDEYKPPLGCALNEAGEKQMSAPITITWINSPFWNSEPPLRSPFLILTENNPAGSKVKSIPQIAAK